MHRRIPGGGVAVPAGWFIVLSVVACVGAAGWLGLMVLGPESGSAEDAQSASTPSAPATTPAPTLAPTTATPTPTPEPTPTKAPTKAPVERTAAVSVLNNTGIANLARTYSARVSGAGWNVAALGNWRGQIVSNTVYYPGALKDQAELLASDVGISRVLPSIASMPADRLTIILSGPQQ